MEKFTDKLRFQSWDYGVGSLTIRTSHRVEFQSDRFGDIDIPSGTLSDGASIPRLFWPIFAPFDSEFFPAAVLHDSIYRNRSTKFTRHQADLIFLEAMESLGVGCIRCHLIYRAVRTCGGAAWNKNRP